MKTLIITGASRGIGKETALALASSYDYMALCSRNSADDLLNVKHLVEDTHCLCDIFSGDAGDYSFVADMVSSVLSKSGRIDTLINNAGISKVGLFTDMSPSQWNHIISSNLTSVYNTCHCVVPRMVHQKSGSIINVSSVWGLVGASCEVAYSATKGAINSFTTALAKELAPSNISVNAIAFGAIDTDMNSQLSDDELSALCDEIPFGRMGTPSEAASCIKNLLSMPTYLTGEVLKFDGGWI